MIKRLLNVTMLLIWLSGSLSGQIIESSSSKIYINNRPVEIPVKDSIPPSVSLVSPDIEAGDNFHTDRETLLLVGKVIDNSIAPFLIINDKNVVPNSDGIFRSEIKLQSGENRIKIIAMDSDNNLSDYEFLVNYNPLASYDEELNIIGQYYALIIANNNYSDPGLADLDNPVRDAISFYNVITSKYIFEPSNVTFLRDANRGEIISALDGFAKKLTNNDNFLIFYAGHGYWDANSRIGFWLPTDAKVDSKAEWIRNSTIRDYLKEITSNHTLLITDACFSGSIFKSRGFYNNTSLAIKILYELPSRKAMTSGTLTEVPDESAFLRYLIDRLANNEAPYLSGQQLFSSFQMAVINNSKALPQYGVIMDVGDEGGDFIFIRRKE